MSEDIVRGGPRQGCGRKKGSRNKEHSDRVKFGTTVSPLTHDILMQCKAEGKNLGQVIDRAMELWVYSNTVRDKALEKLASN